MLNFIFEILYRKKKKKFAQQPLQQWKAFDFVAFNIFKNFLNINLVQRWKIN